MALTDTLTAIGDAIRVKDGSAEPIPLLDMPDRIRAIPSGGGPEIVFQGIATHDMTAGQTVYGAHSQGFGDFATKLADPFGAQGPTANMYCAAFSRSGLLFAVAGGGTNAPQIRLYKRPSPNQTDFEYITSLEGLSRQALAVAFSPDERFMAVGSNSDNKVRIYEIADGAITLHAELEAVANASANINSLDFSTDGKYLAAAAAATPFLALWSVPDNFEKLPNPATPPTGAGNSVRFSADSSLLAVGHNSAPRLTVYRVLGKEFAKLPNPAVTPTGNVTSVAFHPGSSIITAVHASAPYFDSYKIEADLLEKQPVPVITPSSAAKEPVYTPDGRFLLLATTNMPHIMAYRVSGDVLELASSPYSAPAGTANGVAVSPDGTVVAVAHNTSPFCSLYQTYLTDFVTPTTLTGVSNLVLESSGAVGIGVAIGDAVTGAEADMGVLIAAQDGYVIGGG